MATLSIRINTLLLVLVVLMAGAIITMLATRAYGGPLDPQGPPAATDGVRGPGTPISSLPFTTTAGGYYYVTRNLSALAGQSGITICCSNTTVDLGGFTLYGAGAGMSPGDGIYNAGARNVVIRNGAVRGWANGINLGGTYSRVEGVYATANLATGIVVGPGSEVSDCVASLNATFGISASYATVRNCTIAESGLRGISVADNSLIEGNRVNANPNTVGIYIGGNNTTVRNNESSGGNSNAMGLGSDIFPAGTGDVIMGNVYCTLDTIGAGANLVVTGNVDRANVC